VALLLHVLRDYKPALSSDLKFFTQELSSTPIRLTLKEFIICGLVSTSAVRADPVHICIKDKLALSNTTFKVFAKKHPTYFVLHHARMPARPIHIATHFAHGNFFVFLRSDHSLAGLVMTEETLLIKLNCYSTALAGMAVAYNPFSVKALILLRICGYD
jgi:hypothetical protein